MATRKEIRNLKYHAVMNAYENSTLARRARDWSWKRINNELAVKKRKTVTIKDRDARQLTPRQERYYRNKLNKTIYGLSRGLSPSEVRRIRGYRRQKIESSALVKSIEDDYSKQGREAKKDLWKTWSKKGFKFMPPYLKKQAIDINRNTTVWEAGKRRKVRLDDNDSYGYMVVYFMWVEGHSKEFIQKNIARPDRLDPSTLVYVKEVTPSTNV